MNGRTGQYNVWPRRPPETLVAIGRVQDAIIRRHTAWLRTRGLSFDCTVWEMCGCTTVEFVQHIESRFLDQMDWSNFGDWTIDHIFPLSKVAGEKLEDILGAFNILNLQPLWKRQNLSKGHGVVSDRPLLESLRRHSKSGLPEEVLKDELKTKKPNQALQTTSVTRSGFGKVSVSDRQRRGV